MTPNELKEVVPNPKEVILGLDKFIIGQEHTKKCLALMVVQRGVRKLCRAGKIALHPELQKNNIMLLGPTGVGKTSVMKALETVTGIPISITDVTAITSAGYIGGKVEDVLVRHVEHVNDWFDDHYDSIIQPTMIDRNMTKTSYFSELVETGIVYIDEIDKIKMNKDQGLDINGNQVQNELLKMLEGHDVNLSSSRLPYPRSGIRTVQTKDIVFVVGGAFAGLDDVIFRRVSKESSIGFNSTLTYKEKKNAKDGSLFAYAITDDLIEYGFKPEFLGRVPVRSVLSALTTRDLKRIIMEPEMSVFKQYQSFFSVFGVELEITDSALNALAQCAIETKIGARAIKTLFVNLLSDYIFNLYEYTESKLIVTKEEVLKRCK